MTEEAGQQKKEISEELKDLVIERLDVLPSHVRIHIGSVGEFTREQLIECVKQGDEVGQKIVDIELSFLRALKEGVLLEQLNQN
ncbi:MAG: hypothetical protein NTW18_05055 [Candidatus Omnitrophica bacterium]|nr:hypothetical protein [Candidatus Omnitrophota bacterium]